jgi:hypothetical protein
MENIKEMENRKRIRLGDFEKISDHVNLNKTIPSLEEAQYEITYTFKYDEFKSKGSDSQISNDLLQIGPYKRNKGGA